jgi:hypothetical protein
MAALFRTDRAGHDRRREAGRLFFFGPIEDEDAPGPTWLDRLLRAVADSIVSAKPVVSLAYRYYPDQTIQDVHVLPAGYAGPAWAVDVEKLRKWFGRIDRCGWYATPAEEGDGPYLWIEGEFDDHEVFLRVLPTHEEGNDDQVWRRSTK